MIGQPQRGTEEEMERARAIKKPPRDASGLTWRAFAVRLGEKDGGKPSAMG